MTLVDQTITHEQEYRITELVYDGSMNALYAGQWLRLEQQLYVSVLSGLDSLKLTRKAVQRIRNNLHNNVGRLRHPNLPDVIDFGEGDHIAPFTIMRLPPGRLLVQRLEDGPLGTLETHRVIRDVAAALMACRQSGLPHRGPTADRVWLTDDGDAVLLGLGEVLYRHDSYSMGGARRVDLIWHLPPEAFSGEDEDDRSDELDEPPNYRHQLGGTTARAVEDSEEAEVFALGCLAYHCLAGHHPYFGLKTAPSSGIAALVTDARIELDQRLVREPIDVALARDPGERFPNVEEFVRELGERLRVNDAASPLTHRVRPRSAIADDGAKNDEVDVRPANGETDDASVEPTATNSAMLWRGVAAILFISLLIYAYLDLRRPTSILITSSPSGIELEEVTGHLEQYRGRTPLILHGRKQTEKLTVRAIGPNDEKSEPVTLDPATFQDLGRCARTHIDASFVAVDGGRADATPRVNLDQPAAPPTDEAGADENHPDAVLPDQAAPDRPQLGEPETANEPPPR